MRIGELAGMAGVTTRAVRHYHRIGLLPEPPRLSNGYREYSLSDAVALARVRRLTELGLSLDEVHDVLGDDAGKELTEVLTELDADLARQEASIRQRRVRLAQLLAQEEDGTLSAEAPVSPALTTLFDEMAHVSARIPGPEPATAAKERELLSLLETSPSALEGSWLDGMVQALKSDPKAIGEVYAVYARFDELEEASEEDSRVEMVAQGIVQSIPTGVLEAMTFPEAQEAEAGGGFAEALFADFAPAQAAAVRRAVQLLQERAR